MGKESLKQLWSYGQNIKEHILTNPRMNVIVGSIGMGKSAHTFLLAELKHRFSPKNPVFIHVFEESKREKLRLLLPSWIKLSTPDNIIKGRIDYRSFPHGSIIIIEELAGVDNSKNRAKDELAQKLSYDMMTVRHRNQFVFGNIQNTALLNKDHFRGGTHLHFKAMSNFAISFERQELADYFNTINNHVSRISNQYNVDLRSLVYISDLAGDGVYKESLPSFWSNGLSNIWGDTHGS